jgi:uncharacterized protein
MRWKGRRQSSNIEDRRGASPVRGRTPGGLGGSRGLFTLLPLLFRVLGTKGGLVVVAGLFAVTYFTGGNLGGLLGGLDQAGPVQAESRGELRESTAEQELSAFVSVVLADTEDTWHALFEAEGRQYREPKLVLYRGAVESACGMGQAAMGPFYCPGDEKVYLDLGFFDDLGRRHGAPGDFAQAYVVAHEVGHHVQTLLGISAEVHKAKRRVGEAEANGLSVMQELQADCFAGIWGYHANRSRKLLEQGDIDEGLQAASAIGDDRLQRQARGYVTPETFTHGTSAQRVTWFRTGLESGQLAACNTFDSEAL